MIARSRSSKNCHLEEPAPRTDVGPKLLAETIAQRRESTEVISLERWDLASECSIPGYSLLRSYAVLEKVSLERFILRCCDINWTTALSCEGDSKKLSKVDPDIRKAFVSEVFKCWSQLILNIPLPKLYSYQ